MDSKQSTTMTEGCTCQDPSTRRLVESVTAETKTITDWKGDKIIKKRILTIYAIDKPFDPIVYDVETHYKFFKLLDSGDLLEL